MNLDKNRVLVTGGAGFIGSFVVEELLHQGQNVVVFDNFSSGSLKNLKIAKTLGKNRLKIIKGDVRSLQALEKAARGVNVVYHLAVQPLTLGLENPLVMDQVNSTGTLNAIHASYRAGAKRFNYVSSSEVYGTAQKVPMEENHPLVPRTVYAASKLAGESYVMGYHNTHGLDYSIIRPFNSYGPRHRDDGYCAVLFRFFQRVEKDKPLLIYGDGKQTRDMSFVEDTAHGIVLAGQSRKLVNSEVNIGAGQEVSINKLAKLVLNITGSDLKLEYTKERHGDVRRHLAGIAKARRVLNFRPKFSLEEGIQKTWKWYSQNR